MKKKILLILLMIFSFVGIAKAADIQDVYLDKTILVDKCTVHNSTDDHLSLINIGNDKCLVTPVKVGNAQLNLSPATSATQEVKFYNVLGTTYNSDGDYVDIGKFVNTINTGKVSDKILAEFKKTLDDSSVDPELKAAYYDKFLYLAVGSKSGDETILKIKFDEGKHILSNTYAQSDVIALFFESLLSEWLSEAARNYAELEKVDKNQNKEIYDKAVETVLSEIFKVNHDGVNISYELLLDNKINDKILAKYTELLQASNKSEDPTTQPGDNNGPGVENPDTGFGSYLFVIVLGIVAIVLVTAKGRKIYKI